MTKRRKLAMATAVGTVAFVLGAAATVIAGPPFQQIDACHSGCTGTQITQVKTIGSGPDAGFSTTSADYMDVPGASRTMSVDSNGAMLVSRFQADVACTGTPGQGCAVRFFIDSGAASFGTASATFGTSPLTSQSRAIERSVAVSGHSGSYVVQVQARAGSGAQISLSNWHLTVERIKRLAQRAAAGPPSRLEGKVVSNEPADDATSFDGSWSGTAQTPSGNQVPVSASVGEGPGGEITGTADWGGRLFALSGREWGDGTAWGLSLVGEGDGAHLKTTLTYSSEEGGPHFEGSYELTTPGAGKATVEKGSITLVVDDG